MYYLRYTILFLISPALLFANNDSLNLSFFKHTQFNADIFAEAFYAYDFSKPQKNQRQVFFYNYNRHNDFNINLACLRLNWDNPNYKIFIGVQAGTYSYDNYIKKPYFIKHINRAYCSFRLSKNNRWWIDMGVMDSYIGFESAVSFDNYNLTRSLIADNSPYYVSGAKLNYIKNEKLNIAFLLLNGWQNILKPTNRLTPAYGTQIQYKNNNQIWNLSSYAGDEYLDSINCTRIFNNFYIHGAKNKNTNFILGFDLGMQQNPIKRSKYDVWYGGSLIIRQKFHQVLYGAIRCEIYKDEQKVIIKELSKPVDMQALSVNLDFCPSINIMLRIEYRILHDINNTFLNASANPTNINQCITTSFSIRF